MFDKDFWLGARKALGSAVVTAAFYLAGVIPATGGFGDVTTVQWLGLVVALGGAFGVTYYTGNYGPKAPLGPSSDGDL